MLNIKLITSAMQRLGLSQAGLAEVCDVSREAVSKWIANEALPRPKKLVLLAEKLQISVEELLGAPSSEEPVIAYRTRRNRVPTGDALKAGNDVALRLKELVQYIPPVATLFEPPVLRDPSIDEDYIKKAADAVRRNIGVSSTDVISREKILELLHDFGAYLVPTFWGGDKHGHENAMSVYLADSKVSWVLFNLGCRQDDFKYWLAHEYGHCLTLHSLKDDEGEVFAEKFAQHLLFPEELAEMALLKINECSHRQSKLELVNWFAGKYDISPITVVRAADRVANNFSKKTTGLDSRSFYINWNAQREKLPSMAEVFFGNKKLSIAEYVTKSEEIFRTPIFKALAAWQSENGGKSPAFVSEALNLDLAYSLELASFLMEKN